MNDLQEYAKEINSLFRNAKFNEIKLNIGNKLRPEAKANEKVVFNKDTKMSTKMISSRSKDSVGGIEFTLPENANKYKGLQVTFVDLFKNQANSHEHRFQLTLKEDQSVDFFEFRESPITNKNGRS